MASAFTSPYFFGVFVRPGLGAVFIDSGVQMVLSFRLMMIVLISPFVRPYQIFSFSFLCFLCSPKFVVLWSLLCDSFKCVCLYGECMGCF